MASITLRSVKGSPLTNTEVDNNFSNINNELAQKLTGNQTVTLSGDVTGSGTTSIAVTLSNSGVTAGTYTKVTVDAKGRVTSGAALSSADLPTYTGSISSSQVTTALGYTPPQPGGTGASGTWGISITGTSRGVGTTDPAIGTGGLWVVSASGLNVARNGTSYVALDSGNYNSYVPSLTGSGASGTWSINISGNAATVGSLSTSQLFNNMGQNHATYTDANSIPGFGTYYLQGTTNGPAISGATQYFGITLGLGNEYGYASYASQLYWPRTPVGGSPYLSVRFRDGGTWTGWSKVYAGYADSAGNASTVTNGIYTTNIGSYAPTLTGGGASGTWSINVTGNAGSVTNGIYTTNIGSYAPSLTGGGASGTWGISISGNAATASAATRTSGVNGYAHAGTGMYAFYNWGGVNGGTSAPSDTSYTIGISVGSNPSDQAYGFQIARNMWNSGLWTRAYDGSWGSWIRLLDTSNYNSYVPTFTGSGAYGTWGINISGTAAVASSVAASGISGQTGMWTSAARPGPYRLYRRDSDDPYNVQTYWTGSYWRLYGYYNDTGHADTHVGYADSAGNSSTVGGIGIHSGRNNEANKVVRTDGNGYIQAGYINSSNGDENNASSPARVWGTNGSDSYMRSYQTAYLSVGRAQRANGNMYIDDNHGYGIVGVYSSYRYQGVFAMGDSYKLPADGTSTGSLYGIAWSHPNAGGVAGNLDSHGMLVLINGGFGSCMSYSIKASGNITAYSDERLKTNWQPMPENFVERLAQVKVGIYDRTDGVRITQVGVSAQSLRLLLPAAVTAANDGMQTLSVSYGNAALASAVELAKEIVALKKRIEMLESKRAA